MKSNLWFKVDKTSYGGSKIDAKTSQFGLQQLINEPTHLVADSSSFIDLKFTSQPNLVIKSGVHSPLHRNGIPEFLDFGRKSWTLDSGLWTFPRLHKQPYKNT